MLEAWRDLLEREPFLDEGVSSIGHIVMKGNLETARTLGCSDFVLIGLRPEPGHPGSAEVLVFSRPRERRYLKEILQLAGNYVDYMCHGDGAN